MIRRPPRSTLFPTRRSSDLLGQRPLDPRQPVHLALLVEEEVEEDHQQEDAAEGVDGLGRGLDVRGVGLRSEEHTSELQSRQSLVCRLLLEKKKKHKNTATQI